MDWEALARPFQTPKNRGSRAGWYSGGNNPREKWQFLHDREKMPLATEVGFEFF
jgi:hypothetical protein